LAFGLQAISNIWVKTVIYGKNYYDPKWNS
jgi:hypothetical protein